MKTLERELQSAGASAAEARDLAALASRLKRLPSPAARNNAPSRRAWKFGFYAGSFASAGLAMGMALIVYAQAALPGSWPYVVQKTTDTAVVHVQPQYRATVMMKRADQVRQLIARHAAKQTVVSALADYQTAAESYKTMRTNYAAFEYCEATLRHAAANAPTAERAAIEKSLKALNDV